MALFVRTFLIWLVVLAIPAQGVAAATMAFCGPNHDTGGFARAEVSANVSSHSHHGDAVSVKEAYSSWAVAEPIADDTAAAAKSSTGVKHKCSACASCCSLSAILTTVLVVPATDSTPTVFTAVAVTVDAFAVDGPDRPPRNVLE